MAAIQTGDGVSFLVTVILQKKGLKASATGDLRYLTAFAKKKLDQVIVTANRNPGRERSTPDTLHPPFALLGPI